MLKIDLWLFVDTGRSARRTTGGYCPPILAGQTASIPSALQQKRQLKKMKIRVVVLASLESVRALSVFI
jgi:hypothetical protein